jgi:hypothetical protein
LETATSEQKKQVESHPSDAEVEVNSKLSADTKSKSVGDSPLMVASFDIESVDLSQASSSAATPTSYFSNPFFRTMTPVSLSTAAAATAAAAADNFSSSSSFEETVNVDELYPDKSYDEQQVNVVSRITPKELKYSTKPASREKEKNKVRTEKDNILDHEHIPLDIRFKAAREKFESMIHRNSRQSNLPPSPQSSPSLQYSSSSSSQDSTFSRQGAMPFLF